ncbi:MAG TPA: cupin domain-containing protein [Terriglobales bacterium]|nr:cupin domain-containing protein [Terriglobales bacterium]
MAKKKAAKKKAVSSGSASRKRNARAKSRKPQLMARKAASGELKHIPWNTVELETMNPLLSRQLIVGQDIMVARVLMKKGAIVPLHSHHNEQVTYILEGALKFWIDGKEIVVSAGEVLTIPRHMPHKAEALVDTVDVDVFNPPRADWINKEDQYLRADEGKHTSDRLWKQG